MVTALGKNDALVFAFALDAVNEAMFSADAP